MHPEDDRCRGPAVRKTLIERLLSPYRGIDRRVLWVMLCNLLFIGARLAVLTFLAIYFVRNQGLPAALVGVAFLVENIARAFAAPIAGSLSDRIGRLPLLVASAVGAAILVPAFLAVRDPSTLFIWSVAVGLVQAPFFPVSTALLVDLVPAERRQRAFALNYTGLSLGFTVAIVPAGFLAERNFVLLGLAAGATYLLIPIIVLTALRGAGVPTGGTEGAGVVARAVLAFRDRAFVGFALLALAFPLSLGIISLAMPLYAADSGLTTREIGLVLAVNGVLVILLAVPVNAALERFGPFRSLPYSAALIAAAYAGFAVAPNVTGLFIALVFFSAGEVIFSAALPAAVAALAPTDARGTYQGAWAMVLALAIGSALFLAGLGRDLVGWPATWTGFIALTLAGGVGLAVFGGRLGRATATRAASQHAQ
jgi:MFS family permease